MDNNFIYVPDAIKEHENSMIEADWNADADKREFHKAQLEHYQSLLDKGELYEPKF